MRSFVIVTTLFIGAAPACVPRQASPRHPYCEIETTGRSRGPSADVCEQVARRWHVLMGSRAITGVIRLVEGTDHRSATSAQDWVLEWPAPAARRQPDPNVRSDGFAAYEAENILPHEAGHHVFRSYTIFFTRTTSRVEYGSMAPDWFDEAPAVWMESAEMRTRRVKPVIGTAPSLERLVTMEHPGREALIEKALNPERRWRQRTVVPPCPACTFLPESVRNKYRVTDVGADARGRPDTNDWYSAIDPQKRETLEEREFYPLSYILLRFIHLRGGTIAVRELISRYREDPRPRVDVLAALPGLPPTVQAFEREWHAFLRNPPAEVR